MRDKLLQEFEAIANNAVDEAEDVKCDFEAFVEGLAYIVDRLKDRLSEARDEAEARAEDRQAS